MSRRIYSLDPEVVNRIAAGEVLQRPANAVKELIENSMDAGASSIQVFVKEGGLKLLQITDNGHGIEKEDFLLLCKRFSTSKLEKFEDLYSLESFGFRGEALASISFASKLTITSRTKGMAHAMKATFVDGQMTLEGSKVCAGNIGTMIQVEDLFYNAPLRRKAMKSANEEYSMILDVVQKYALNKNEIAFSLRKDSSVSPDLVTCYGTSQIDLIRQIYGSAIANELIMLNERNEEIDVQVRGYFSNANFNLRKGIFINFINGRLVETPALKKAIEFLYAEFLPKGTHPFILLSLKIPSRNVDINVHPTKSQVQFLNESEILSFICECLREKLCDVVQSRAFLIQKPSKVPRNDSDGSCMESPYSKVRVDSQSRTLDSFNYCAPKEIQNKTSHNLRSVKELESYIISMKDSVLTEHIKEMVFVGMIDSQKCLVQSKTKLFQLNLEVATINLLYQHNLSCFGNLHEEKMETPIDIFRVFQMKAPALLDACSVFQEHSKMLKAYFCIQIEDMKLKSLPVLLEGRLSCRFKDRIEMFLIRLVQRVDWISEKNCLDAIMKEISFLLCPLSVGSDCEEVVKNLLIASMKKSLILTRSMKPCLIELTDVKDLYKIFERC